MSEEPSASRGRTRTATQPYGQAISWAAAGDMEPLVKEMLEFEAQQEESSNSDDYSDFEDDAEYEAKTSKAQESVGPQHVIDPTLLGGAPNIEDTVEEDIQDDFQRLLDEMNQGDALTASAISKHLEQSEAEMDLREQMRAAARIGKPKGQPRRANYSDEVRDLISNAQLAFVDRRIEEAINFAREAVRIEPRAVEAWSVLAGSYQDLDDHDAALKFRIMKAHLIPDAATWKELALESQQMGLERQALYCYRKAIQLNKTDIDVIWDRAFLLKEMKDYQQALEGFQRVLELVPHDPNVLQQIYQVCVQLDDLPRALHHYQAAFSYHSHFPPNEDLFGIPSIAILGDIHIALGNYESAVQAVKAGVRWLQDRSSERFWELVDDDREYDPEGVVREKEMLEGQEQEQEQDEHEVPPAHNPLPMELRHRLALARLRIGDDAEAQIHIETLRSVGTELHPEYFDFYLEIADVYYDRTMWEEAYEIYEDVHSRSETVSVQLLSRMSKCLRNLGRIEDAIAVLEHIVEKAVDDFEIKLDLVELYEAAGRLEEAFKLVTEVQESRRKQTWAEVAAAGRKNEDERNIFEEPITLDKESKSKKALGLEEKAVLEQQQAELARKSFDVMKRLEERVEAEDPIAIRAWMQEARRMTDTFRQSKVLFAANRYGSYKTYVGKSDRPQGVGAGQDIDREAADIASRLQEEMDEDDGTRNDSRKQAKKTFNDAFHGIGFDDWLLLIVRYAFRLLREGERQEADDVLRHTGFAVIFSDVHYQDVFSLALLACAIFLKDTKQILEQSRKLILGHQFSHDPLRIFVAALGGGISNYIAFTDTKMSKFLTREIKLVNAIATGAKVHFHVARQRYVVPLKAGTRAQEDDEDDGEGEDVNAAEEGTSDDKQAESTRAADINLSVPTAKGGRVVPKRPLKLPTKDDPVMLAVYSHMLLAVKSYQSALFYLMHAYEINPYDPLLCLTIAVCYVSRAMQRQSDNRHHQIVQGLAFLSRYRTARGSDLYDEEVEYNFARYFHQLGLLNVAEKHYSKVLDLTRRKVQSGERVSPQAPVKEAAYNLSLIYATTGAADVAESIYREWLTL